MKNSENTDTEEMMSYLLNRSAHGLPLKELSNIFDQLIWIMDDNGFEIDIVRNKWLSSSDKNKVVVALQMTETFPFDSREDLVKCFNQIEEKWQDLSSLCAEVLERWEKQNKSKKT